MRECINQAAMRKAMQDTMHEIMQGAMHDFAQGVERQITEVEKTMLMEMRDISLSIAALQDTAAMPSSVEDKAQRKDAVNKVSQEQSCAEEEKQLLVTCAEVPDSICKKEEQVVKYASASSKEASRQDQIQVA